MNSQQAGGAKCMTHGKANSAETCSGTFTCGGKENHRKYQECFDPANEIPGYIESEKVGGKGAINFN